MQFTGHQDFLLNQIKNLKFEILPALPIFTPNQEGRVIFINTPGSNYGVYIGTTINFIKLGISSHNLLDDIQGGNLTEKYHLTKDQADALFASNNPSITNPVQVLTEKTPLRFTFNLWKGVESTIINKVLNDESGIKNSVTMLKSGSVVGLTVISTSPCIAGELTVKPTKNNIEFLNTSLNKQLNLLNPTKNYALVAINTLNLTFNAGDDLGCLLDTNNWLTSSQLENISVDIYVVWI